MRNIALSLFTFFLVYFLFIAESVSGSRFNAAAFVPLSFALFSYGSVYLFLSEKFRLTSSVSRPGKIAGTMFFGLIVGTIGMVAFSFVASVKKSNESQAYKVASQKYSDAVSVIVSNIEMEKPAFIVVPDDSDGAPELLIRFPLTVGQAAKNTGVKKLRNDTELEFRYGFSFTEMEPFDFREAENASDLYPCRRGNTTIRFEDPRKSYVNQLILSDPHPQLFVSLYMHGDDCTPDVLAQKLKNMSLYVYLRTVSAGNERPLYKSFPIDSVEL